jgi:hypothetical protein
VGKIAKHKDMGGCMFLGWLAQMIDMCQWLSLWREV